MSTDSGAGHGASQVTLLLQRWSDGDRRAAEELMPLVYGELRRLAGGYMRRERAGHTLQATELVHEAYFRLAGQQRAVWKGRAHFFAIAAQAMRRILVDHARRSGGRRRVESGDRRPIEDAGGVTLDCGEEILDLHRALERLAELSPRQARIVELRFFGGMTVSETAEALSLSVPTVVRDWRFARAWLRRELGHVGGGG